MTRDRLKPNRENERQRRQLRIHYRDAVGCGRRQVRGKRRSAHATVGRDCNLGRGDRNGHHGDASCAGGGRHDEDRLNVVGEPEDTASANLFWDFDQGANGTFDIAGHFQCDQNGLYFELLHSGYRDRDKVFAASRPTARSARVTFPLSELRAAHVSMRAMSRVTGVIGNNVFFDEEDLAPSLRAY